MTRFTKLVMKIRELDPKDDATKLLMAFAEQLNLIRRTARRHTKSDCGKGRCGTSDTNWLKQRMEDKLRYYCDTYGLKEIA